MGSLEPAGKHTEMVKFADDVAIAIPYQNSTDIEQLLTTELTNMKDWCNCNGLILNEKKTKVMLIDKRRNKEELSIPNFDLSDEVKVLGVTLQNNLKWNAHVDRICKTAAQRIYLLKVMKNLSVARSDLIQVYKSHIQSVLEYNAPLLVGITKQNSSAMERIRKRVHRIICGAECNCDALTSLSSRREARALAFFKNMFEKDHILHHLCPTILPYSSHVNIPYSKTERRAKSYIPFCSYLYNCSLKKF